MKYLYSILLLCTGVTAMAQEFMLNGKIIADSIASREVNIVNLSTEKGTINQTDGSFKIEVSPGDTLFFSSLQYEPYQINITAEHRKKQALKIYLFSLINELEEVKVSTTSLSGDLHTDIDRIAVNPYFDPASKGLPVNAKPKLTIAQRRLYTATTSAGGIIPLDPIINALSGRLALLKRLREYEIQDEKVVAGLRAMQTSFFTEELTIPEELVEDFMYYCISFDDFQKLIKQKTNRLKLLEFFEERAFVYKKIKAL